MALGVASRSVTFLQGRDERLTSLGSKQDLHGVHDLHAASHRLGSLRIPVIYMSPVVPPWPLHYRLCLS
ncbi:hypothetical protein Btru_007013 [Bulinus truncatus]|nr:hypothetical protein Btru_007013 [Bulinus truncatus]